MPQSLFHAFFCFSFPDLHVDVQGWNFQGADAAVLQGEEVGALVLGDAALDADALILVTEWKEFRLPTWGVIKKAMKQPVVLDGRNIYDGDELQEMGFVYHCIGR